MRPPKNCKPDPRITGAMAPISLDRVHGFSNPIAPEKSYVKWLFQEWGKIMPELYDRGYWSIPPQVSSPELPALAEIARDNSFLGLDSLINGPATRLA